MPPNAPWFQSTAKQNTDSAPFEDLVPAISVRENERGTRERGPARIPEGPGSQYSAALSTDACTHSPTGKGSAMTFVLTARALGRGLASCVVAGGLLLHAPVALRAQDTTTSAACRDAARRLAQQAELLNDWASLGRYREANARLGPPAPGEDRVVFLGNSIFDSWARYLPAEFPGRPYIDRGISGQTTPQMLVRFRQDVISLRPKVVVILAGTNDIAGNTGPSTLQMIEDNLASMAELARANGIRVVLASVLPTLDYPWRRGLEPAPKILELNAWMKDYAAAHAVVYLDYHSAMADERQGLRSELTTDGVHPNEAGYRVMAPLTERAIEEALRGR